MFFYKKYSKAFSKGYERRSPKHFSYPNLKERRNHYCFFTVSQYNHSEEFLKEAKRLAQRYNEPYRLINSNPSTRNEKLRFALAYLHSEEAKNQGINIVNGYDYAWIKRTIDKELFPGFKRLVNCSDKNFVKLINRLGFDDISDRSVINRYYHRAEGREIPWEFSDCIYNPEETERRNDLINAFVEIMNEI